jgi:hypothetical protein
LQATHFLGDIFIFGVTIIYTALENKSLYVNMIHNNKESRNEENK